MSSEQENAVKLQLSPEVIEEIDSELSSSARVEINSLAVQYDRALRNLEGLEKARAEYRKLAEDRGRELVGTNRELAQVLQKLGRVVMSLEQHSIYLKKAIELLKYYQDDGTISRFLEVVAENEVISEASDENQLEETPQGG